MNLIFVAGMHRSGTSFVTELVKAMGAEVGTNLLPAASDNPHGFFEHVDVKRINDELLSRLGGTWDRPPEGLTTKWPDSPGLDRLRREAEAVIAAALESSSEAQACAVKDPRLSLTGPFWSSVAAIDVSLVPLRDPIEVVQSLRHRNGMAPARAAALWTRYTLDALIGLPHVEIVPLAALASGSDDALMKLALQVDLADGAQAALEIAKSRSRTWSPDSTFAPTSDDSELRLACSLFALLSANIELDALRPALVELSAPWGPTPLISPEDILTDDSDGVRRTAVEAATHRLSSLRRDLENERLSALDLRHERNEAQRDARAKAEQAEKRVRVAEEDLAHLQQQVDTDRSRAETATRIRGEQQRAHEAVRAQNEAARAEVLERLAAVELERTALQEALNVAETTTATLRRAAQVAEAARERESRLARSSEHQFQRLKGRRSVRVALGLASTFRPAFRFVRSAGGVRAPRRVRVRTGAKATVKRRKTPEPKGAAVAVSRRSMAEPTRSGPTPTYEISGRVVERDWLALVDRLSNAPTVTVVVPVYNAPADVERCIAEFLRWTPAQHELLLIDDGSTDPSIGPMLAGAASEPNVRVLRNAENLGFTRTVNRGFQSTSCDVVVLNSDARVGPNWLQNLRIAAYSGHRVASATAVSDNAGAFSLPETGKNESPGLDEPSLARLYAHESKKRWVNSPTGHGFCMYIRRDAVTEVGTFDVEQFPRGYGEENDWSMRALKAGWTHVIDESTMVFHSNAASFDPNAKQDLVAKARMRVNTLHPEYTTRIRSFLDVDMIPVREDARRIDAMARSIATTPAAANHSVRPRLLSIVQAGRGGTPKTNRDLMTALQPHWDPWILTSDAHRLELFHVVDGGLELVEEFVSDASFGANRSTDSGYRNFVAQLLVTMSFELVHVRHLFKHTQDDVPDILAALGIPSVLSFHDYYFVCPNVHLLDEHGSFCGGHCTPGPGDCDLPVPGRPLDRPLKHHWVHDWRSAARTRFDAFDEFVTTTETAKGVLCDHYPELEARGINVIPHGRDLDDKPSVADPPDPRQIRIVVIGNLSGPKGGHFLRELLDRDTEQRLDVHIVGACDEEFSDLRCTFHGRYERDALDATLKAIQPAFAALLSIWPETWSHTLTEAWSVGVPVLVTQEGGALVERVRGYGGGWILDAHDIDASLARILAISQDPDEWRRHAVLASVDHLTSAEQMAETYRSVYDRVLTRSVVDRPFVDIRVVIDEDGKSPGSAHIRTLRRFHHPEIRRWVSSAVNSGSVPAAHKGGFADLIWIERTALPVEFIDDVLTRREVTGARLVVDLDDDLLHAEGLPRQFATYVPKMRELVEAADLVTVSTDPLAIAIAPWTTNVVVLPNELDETIWGSFEVSTPRKPPDDTIDILYMGTATHAGDLELVRAPIQRLASSRSGRVRLHVVGGAPQRSDEWFERIHVPNDAKEYPSFVAWLRTIGDRFDFAIAPLEQSIFNSCKSDLKFLEYSALGLPTILSDCPAYRDTVTHGLDGHLVGDDADEWFEALVAMSSRDYQHELRSNALKYATSRTIAANATDFLDIVNRLLTSA